MSRFFLKIAIIALFIGIVKGLQAEDFFGQPFFVNKIEVTPGKKLMLHPCLPYFDGLPYEEYTLSLDFPEGIELSDLRVLKTDKQNRVKPLKESVRKYSLNGRKRMELSYTPDLEQCFDGIDLYMQYRSDEDSTYDPVIKFFGTFDWKIFSTEIQIPENNLTVTPLLLKWRTNPTQSGILSFGSLQIRESDSGKIVYDFKSAEPVVMHLREREQDTYWLPHGKEESVVRLNLIPGKKYTVECRAKGENIKSLHNTVRDVLSKKISYTRTFILNVADDIRLPDKLSWKIKDKKGKIYKEGMVDLVPPIERVAPVDIDTSVWICETFLPKDPLAVQRLYVEKLHSWGLNTVEPSMHMPAYGILLSEKTLSMPIAMEAKKLKMRVRTYLHFLYEVSKSARYLEKNPQYVSIGPRGEKARMQICQTALLEEGNPWLTYYMQVITKSVGLNELDGVFYDFEFNAAPYIKARKKHDGSRRWGSTCMCERCRKAFKDYANLDYVPTIEECCKDSLYEKWIDFRCRQNIELWKRTSCAAKGGNPNASFAIYSGKPDAYCREGYGVDWTMAAPYLDFAMQRTWCPTPKAAVDKFRTVLEKGMNKNQPPPKIIYQLGMFTYSDEWMYGVDDKNIYNQLPYVKNNIVRAVALCGSYGWSFNGIWGMDDQLTLPIKEANAILAKYEDYFVNGKKNDNKVKLVKGDVEIATWQLDKRFITFVFNNKTAQQNVVLKMDDNKEASIEANGRDCTIYEWSSNAWYDIFNW